MIFARLYLLGSALATSALAVVFASCLSCASKLGTLVASPDDYADYRQTRVAATVPERLRAASLYLERHETGAFRESVEAWFLAVEPVFYEAHSDSLAGMEKYLTALPTGPHAESALQRRDAFQAQARIQAGEGIARRGADFERRLAAAARAREDVITTFAAWIGHALDFDGFGRAPDPTHGAFTSAFAAEPAPKCTKERCTKSLTLPYELEISGKPSKFECHIEVSTGLAKGRVTDVVISGPRLFVRLFEAHEARPIAEDDAGRERALAYVLELTEGAAERALPRARCSQKAAPRAALSRECDGRRLDVFASVPPEESEDRVVIRGRGEL